MKKLKCTFNRIDTEAESLQVQCRGVPILTFNKEDYGEGFERLIGKEFYIKPYECNDVNALNVVGGEDHFGDASEEVKEAWREATHNVLGSKHLEDEELLKTFTSETPVKLYNQETEEPWNTSNKWPIRLINSLNIDKKNPFYGTSPTLALDLSTFKIGQVGKGDTATGVLNTLRYNFLYFSGYNQVTSYNNLNIAKWYDLSTVEIDDDNFCCSDVPTFDRSSLVETPRLAGLPWLKANRTSAAPTGIYECCKQLRYATEDCLPDNLKDDYASAVAAAAFRNCTSLETSLVEPVGHASAMYSGCTSLTKAGSIKNVISAVNMFYGCTQLREVPEGLDEACNNFKRLLEEGKISSDYIDFSRMFKGCTSLTKAVLPTVDGVKANLSEMYTECSNLEEIDLCGATWPGSYDIVGTTIKATTLGDIDLLPDRSYVYGLQNTFDSIGVINVKASGLSAWNHSTAVNYPKGTAVVRRGSTSGVTRFFCEGAYHIKAYPKSFMTTTNMFRNGNLPNSDGFEWWVDYIENDTKYVKTITKKEVEIDLDATSTSKVCEYTVKVPYSSLLQKVYSYEPDFEPLSISKVDARPSFITGSNYDATKDITCTPNDEDKTLDITFTATNIADDSITTLKIGIINGGNHLCAITYVANIDGHEFHGKTYLDATINIHWQIEENVDYSVELIDEE